MRRFDRPNTRRAIVAAAALAWAVFALHALGALGGAGGGLDVLYTAMLVAATTICAVRAATSRTERLPWALIAAALACWAVGDILWSVSVALDRPLPAPSASDSFYLAFYPFAYAGLVALVRFQAGLASRDLWIDGVIGASCATAIAIAVAFPILGVTDAETLPVATNLAYPVLDVVLVVFVVLVFGLSGWRPGRRWLLLGTGLVLMTLADGAYLIGTTNGSYAEGGPIDAGWPAAMLLVAFAAWQPAGTPAAPRESDRRLVLVPVLCGLASLTLLALAVFGTLPDEAALPALLTLLLVTVRMGIAFVEGQQSMEANRLAALTDGLTGLGNRRALLADLDRAAARASAERPWICVVLDLDGFKAYNDAFGHPAGDRLLNRLGTRLAAAVAERGTAYRLGGDEFCVLATAGPEDARRLANAARAALTEAGEGFAVTSSAGVVSLPLDARAPSEVLLIADRRMYADKGRRSSSAGHQSRAVLLRILREREPELHRHLVGVAELARAVGRELGMAGEQLDELARAAELHDIGKIAIPEEILHKPGPLDPEEWAFVRRHTVIGERILSAAPALRPVARLVRSTHERWDGGGYPDGLAGAAIPLGARIVAVCDAYEAMLADRPYRAALTPEQAVAELRAESGAQFDPAVIDVFTAALGARSPEPLSA
ncbi:MAG: diguanylate cyclase [Solirubrobacterales bacterium]|nr:diguanylate cyclase [Solirubrobacterales bacterium]